MDTNEKKPRRPRIGESKNISDANDSLAANTYSTSSANDAEAQASGETGYNRPYSRQGGYNNRPNYRQGGYQQRPYNNYNRQGGYTNRPYNNNYQQRPYNNYNPNPEDAPDTQNNEAAAAQGEHDGYQPRQYNNYNRQGGYNNRYNNNRQGGYNNNRYNNNRPYNNRPKGGYNQQGDANDEGGYQPRQYNNRPYNNRQQGGYNNNRQGGYNNNRQGGYNNPGGYNNNRPGGYNNNRQGGYNNRNRQGGNNFGMPRQGKSFTPRPKRVEYEQPIIDPNEQIRLNKYMANAGICSRREADEFIQQGLVKVNGQVVTELGTKISHSDTVEYDEKVVTLENKCYILLNKPKDCVTTADDPNGRLTVLDLVKGACEERIYPVGRLDRNTTGVLLLTNDGDLASKLTHPKYIKKKIYHVWVDKDIAEDDMQRIADGIELDDGPIHADAISYATETDRNQAGIEIHSGRNRIVRRIFESLGYHVTKLDRVYFAGLTKKNLPRGRWRYLTQEEVNYLKMGTFE